MSTIEQRVEGSQGTTADVVHAVRAGADASLGKAIARIPRVELIDVDDSGMLISGQAAAEAFYGLGDATYERRSLAVTSNIHPAGFDTNTPTSLATAAVERLPHHAHVIIAEGTSLRLTEATAGRGVVPLTSRRRRVIN